MFDAIQQLEAYKIQYSQAILIHAANVPTIKETPIISVEGIKAITFGQKCKGTPMLNILSERWIDFSEKRLNGQFLATINPQLFAQTLWSYIIKGEEQ